MVNCLSFLKTFVFGFLLVVLCMQKEKIVFFFFLLMCLS